MTIRLLAVIALVLVGAALHWLKMVALPLVVAVFLIAVAWPAQRWFERFVSPGLAYAGTILLVTAGLLVFIGALVLSVTTLAAGLPDHAEAIQQTLDDVLETAQRLNLPIGDIEGERLLELVGGAVGAVLDGIRLIGVAFVFTVLGILEVRDFQARLAAGLPPARSEQIRAASQRIAVRFRRAMVAYTAISILTGFLTWLLAAAIGLEFAFVWGFLAFLLNYILFIGPILAVIPPSLFALIQFQSFPMFLVVLVGLGLMQFLIGNYLLPRLEGRVVAISPLLLMFALFFWMLVWGVLGAVMAVPLTIGIVIACEHVRGLKWVPALFGRGRARE